MKIDCPEVYMRLDIIGRIAKIGLDASVIREDYCVDQWQHLLDELHLLKEALK